MTFKKYITFLSLLFVAALPASAADTRTLHANYVELQSTANIANAVTLGVPSTVATPYSLTFPGAPGTSGQVLYTTGSGTLGWLGVFTNPMTTTGDLVYASNTATPATPARLAIGAAGTVLHGGTTPSYSSVALGTDVSGTLPVGNGGTGLTAGTSGGVPYYSASNTLASSGALAANGVVLGGGAGTTPAATTAGSADQVFRVPGAGGAPAFGAVALNQSAAVTSQLGVANGGTGLSTGTSGGVLAYTGSGTLASSGALTANAVVIGGGAGVVPTVATNNSSGTNMFLTQSSSATPAWAAILAADIPSISAAKITSGTLAVAQGGTGVTSSTGSTSVVLSSAPTIDSPVVTTGSTLRGTTLLQNTSGSQPLLNLSEDPDNGTNKVSIQSTANLAGDYTLTLPVDDGGANQVLQTDGSGLLSWATPFTNPMDSDGDMVYGGAAGAPTKLDNGALGKRLRAAGAAAPTWSWQSSTTTLSSGTCNFTITDTDGLETVLCECGGASRTTILPAAASNTGRVLNFKKTDDGTNVVGGFAWVIDGAGSETIDGVITQTIFTKYGHMAIVSDGANWQIIEGPIDYGSYTPTLTGVTNIASSITASSQFHRNGTIVTVSGGFDVNVTAGNVASQIDASIPIPSDFSSSAQANGSGTLFGVAVSSGAGISAQSANNRVSFLWTPTTDPGNTSIYYTYSYVIIP